MGVYIKGMEMPTSCRACHLKMNCDDCEGYECVCVPLHQQIGYLDDLLADKRREDCPLVPVSPHGRLIDDGEFFASLSMDDKTTIVEAMHISELLTAAPTIIPAEEVYGKYTDTAGNLHWTGMHSGEHSIPAEEGEA